MDDVVVGGCSEPKKSDQTVRVGSSDLLRDLFNIFLIKMMLRVISGMALLAALIFIGCEKKEKPADKATTEQRGTSVQSDLPLMPVELIDGTNISMKDVSGKMVLILFQPDCDHCQREAVDIRKNLIAFDGYRLYFISSHPLEVIKQFAVDYDLLTQPDIYFGRTTVEGVLSNFGAISAPSVYIFNEQGKMTAKFNGEVAIDTLVKAL